jgi:hypothetical protein
MREHLLRELLLEVDLLDLQGEYRYALHPPLLLAKGGPPCGFFFLPLAQRYQHPLARSTPKAFASRVETGLVKGSILLTLRLYITGTLWLSSLLRFPLS